jgi:EpsD family peptidyl-prolyl cis-trans isomerase
MNETSSANPPKTSTLGVRMLVIATATLAVLLAGCGDKKKDKAATQIAAKVNKEEISIHQINFLLQQQRGLKPEQADAAGKQILERLIDQELAVQKAIEQKLDRDPKVVQQLEASRREIIARAYVEKSGDAAAKPSADEIKKYYDEKPALFKDRRIYSIQELAVQVPPEQIDSLRTQLQGAKSINDFIEYMKANNIKFAGNQAVRPAEQLPMNMLEGFAKMKDGQALLVPSATGAQVIVLAASRAEPVDEVRARPAIEQFLGNDAKRKLIDAEMKAMRAASRVEYVGKWAAPAASGPDAAPAAVAPAAVPAPPTPTPAASASAAGADADAMSKGLSGLK